MKYELLRSLLMQKINYNTFSKITPRIIALIVILLVGSCVSINSQIYPHIAANNLTIKDPTKVTIFNDFPPDMTTYQIIGEVNIDETFDDLHTDQLFLNRLRKHAASKGADVVVLKTRLTGTSTIVGNYSGTTNVNGQARTQYGPNNSSNNISLYGVNNGNYLNTFLSAKVGYGYLMRLISQ